MGTSMWINRQYPIERQARECVKQIAYLVGIVLNNETPTMGWVMRMFRKISDSRENFFSTIRSRSFVVQNYWHVRALWGKVVRGNPG